MVTSQEIAQAQVQAAAEQQRLAQARQQLTSQQVLRSATRQGQIQIKTQAGRIEAGQRQLTAQQQQLGQIKREVQQYESAVAKQKAYEEGYRLAVEDLQAGRTTYLAGSDASLIEGYKAAREKYYSEQAAYGSPATTLQFGTPAEQARIKSQLGIPKEATEIKPDLKTGVINYTLPEIGKITLGNRGITSIESPYFGKSFTSVEAYNKAVEQAKGVQTTTTTKGVQTIYGTDIKYTTIPYSKTSIGQRGTIIPEKIATNVVVPYTGGAKPFSEFIPIPFLERIKTGIITPKTYMFEPGPRVGITLATPEKLAEAKSYEALGFKPATTWKYEPGFIQYAAAGLVPTTVGEAALFGATAYVGGLAMKAAPLFTSTVFTGFGAKSLKSYFQAAPYTEEKASAATGSLGLLAATKFTEYSLFGKKPYQVKPTPQMEAAVKPFSRQRATLLLKTTKGDYVLGKTKSGEIISIGGGIEKGQTARQAVFAELKQETGLGPKDIIGFKKVGTVVTPEETFVTYTAQVTPKTFAKMKPMSDVAGFVKISPKNPFIKGVTGQTSLQPISRQVPFTGRVRAYEAGLITYAETGVKPTWLAIDTPQGQYFLGTQSRYNVPYTSQKQYLGKEGVLLASGSPAPPVLKRTILPGQSKAIIEGSKTKRGQAEGLYLQPPISAKYNILTKVKLKPSEYAKFLVKSGKLSQFSEIKKFPNKEVVGAYGEVNGRKIILVKSGLSKLEKESTIAHELIHYKTPKTILKLSRIFPYELRPSEQVAFGFEKIMARRGFTTYQIKEVKSPGYIGLSYLGFKTSQMESGVSISFPKRTAMLFKETTKGPIVATPKTYSGMESELIISPETAISTTQKATIASIGLKKVYLQPTKIVSPGKGTKTIMEVAGSYDANLRYITPGEAIAPISSVGGFKKAPKSVISIPRDITEPSKIFPSSRPSKISQSGISFISELKAPSYALPLIETSKISKIYEYKPSTISSIAPSKVPPPEIPPEIIKPTADISYLLKRAKKRRKSFEVLSKRFGKEISLGKYELQTEAERRLGGFLRGTLAASGKIKYEGELLPVRALRSFAGREFRPAKRDLFTVVQRSKFRLGTGSERREIKQAKRKKLKIW